MVNIVVVPLNVKKSAIAALPVQLHPERHTAKRGYKMHKWSNRDLRISPLDKSFF